MGIDGYDHINPLTINILWFIFNKNVIKMKKNKLKIKRQLIYYSLVVNLLF